MVSVLFKKYPIISNNRNWRFWGPIGKRLEVVTQGIGLLSEKPRWLGAPEFILARPSWKQPSWLEKKMRRAKKYSRREENQSIVRYAVPTSHTWPDHACYAVAKAKNLGTAGKDYAYHLWIARRWAGVPYCTGRVPSCLWGPCADKTGF